MGAAAVAATPMALATQHKSDLAASALFGQPRAASPAAKAAEGPSRKDLVRGKMRGLMLDAGRVPETIAYYKRVIDFCSDWALNTIQFRLTDDQGSAMRFASVPGLITHTNAFTPDELKSLVDYAQSHGVDLLPEVESFGHTGYITRSPTYAHLLDRDPDSSSAEFTGMTPVNPESLQIFQKLYREVAAIFPSVYLHGGCDEVNWGGSALSRKALEARTRVQIWAEYLNALNQISVALGKQFIVWGDLVLRKEPEILAHLNKNIIIMDWNYYDNNSASLYAAFEKIRANGSRAIGAPALSCYKWGARAGIEQLRNIDAFSDAYLDSAAPSSLGVVLTNWIPSRYVQDSIWDGFAYAAVSFNEGTATAQTSGFRHFVERHYRASWNETWGEVFQLTYDAAPYKKDREDSSWMGLTLRVPWSSDEELTAVLKSASPPANPFIRIRSLLVQLEPLVMKNLADFQAFALCIDYLEKTFWRESVVIEQAAKKPLDRDLAALLMQGIAERDRDLAAALTADWDRGRFPDATAKLEAVYDLRPKDQLLYQWNRAAAYSAGLAGQPDRFQQLLQSVQPA